MMIGIASAWYFRLGNVEILSLAAVSLFILLCGFSHKAPKWLFGVGVSLFMLAVGAFVEHRQHEAKAPQWGSGARLYEAQLLEVPLHKGTSTKVLANVVVLDSGCAGNARRAGRAVPPDDPPEQRPKAWQTGRPQFPKGRRQGRRGGAGVFWIVDDCGDVG